MTDSEILDNSKRIIDVKKDIDTGDATNPDLEEQVRNEFLKDCVNRARFVDSSLIIGAISEEFKNVFGVDAPHYAITGDCKLAIDKNEDGKFDTNDYLELKNDPMHDPRYNFGQYSYTDCWEVMNAARFDCPFNVSNFKDDPSKWPVEKQNFFVDDKKGDKGSSFHAPMCPPGLNKWAGAKVYDYICKNFDMNEISIYKVFRDVTKNTIPTTFTMQFDGDDDLQCNINEEGRITKNNFEYNLKEGDEYKQLLRDAYDSDGLIPGEAVDAVDTEPIKWYSIKIPVTSTKENGVFYYTYNYEGTPFQNTTMPIISFSLRNNGEKTDFNSGTAILVPDPFQNQPSCGSSKKTSYDYKFCFNILQRKNPALKTNENYDKQRKFLWWELKPKRIKKKYTATFNPINKVSHDVRVTVAKFIKTMLENCIKYYEMIKNREVNNVIPDYEKTLETMQDILKKLSTLARARYADSAWNSFLDSLKTRVIYDITGSTEITPQKEAELFGSSTSSELTFSFDGEREYITDWIPKTIIKWPKFLLRWVKSISEPKKETFKKIKIDRLAVTKNFLYNYVRKTSKGSEAYVGPASGDFTKTLYNSNKMITLGELFSKILSEADKKYLRESNLVKYRRVRVLFSTVYVYTDVFIDNGWVPFNNTKYDIVIDDYIKEMPTYDSIKRATDLNWFMMNNSDLFATAFQTLTNRIDKRTGTLRKTLSLLDSANISIQMNQQKKGELKSLFKYLNAFEITGGFGTKEATIQLTAWEGEDIGLIYSTLERMGTVYLLADNTELKAYNVSSVTSMVASDEVVNATKDIKIKRFNKNYVKTTITELIDQISDTKYEYSLTEDEEIKDKKKYYVLDGEDYRLAEDSEKTEENLENLYERGTASQGPVFKVTLQHEIPNNFKGKNPMLVKVY